MPLAPQAKTLLDKIEQSGIPPYEMRVPEVACQYYEIACEIARGSPRNRTTSRLCAYRARMAT